MTKSEIIAKYPNKSFREVFDEKVKILRSIGTPEQNIKAKKTEYKKIFNYDDSVLNLKSAVENCKIDEMDDQISSRIIFHFSKINDFILWVDDLNLSDKENVGNIFKRFDVKLRGGGFIENMIVRAARGVEVSIGKTVIDMHIEEIKNLSRDLLVYDVENDMSKIKEAVNVASNLIENKENFEKAITTAENWRKEEGKSIAVSFGKKSEIFNLKADEYKSRKFIKMIGHVGWFAGGLFFGLMALIIILIFIFDLGDNNNISIGFALMRISVLFIVSYFAFFMLSQFSNNKKFYESYKFKAIALETMEELVKSYDKDRDRERILNESISIIFSEPKVKEDSEVQKKLLNDLMDIAKKKI